MNDQGHNERLKFVMRNTRVIRPPRQSLETFGTTNIRYHVISEPIYADLPGAGKDPETVVREGTVRAERPQVVTPHYLSRLEGFSDEAEEFLRDYSRMHGQNAPALLYTYKNEFVGTTIVSGAITEVGGRLSDRLDKEKRDLEAVIRGLDEHWDLSVLKFIFELTNSSVGGNVSDLQQRGLLDTRDGLPRDARMRIEQMFTQARRGEIDASSIRRELERWGVFEEYEDRFLSLFRP